MRREQPAHRLFFRDSKTQESDKDRSLDLLLLQFDRLVVNKYTLALVWLRPSPPAYPRRKRHDLLPVDALEQDACRLGRAGLHPQRHRFLDRVCEAELQAHELLTWVFGLAGALLNRRTVSDTDQTKNGRVALGNAHYVSL